MLYFFYYFPLGLDIRLRRVPWATIGLVAACVLMDVAARSDGSFLWRHYESLVYVPESPHLSALLLSAYLHGGWVHLVSNMVSLVVFGPPLEERLGARRFLLLYHAGNVAGNVVQGAIALWWMPEAAGYGILGASGAISALLGAFLLRLGFARLRVGYWAFMPLQAYTRAGVARIPVVLAVTVWLLVQLGITMTWTQGARPQVAAGAHLGGFLAGMALAMFMGLFRAGRAEQFLHRGRTYAERAEWFAAQGEFIEYVRRDPADPEGHLELARTLRLTRRDGEADQHYRAAARLLARAGRWDRVEEVYFEALRGRPEFTLPPDLQFQLAKLLERSLRPQEAEIAYVRFAASQPRAAASALALYRAGCLAQSQDAAWRAGEHFAHLLALHPNSPEATLAREEPGLAAAEAA